MNIGRPSTLLMRRDTFDITNSARGKYAESERVIQKLLTKSGAGGFDYESISANGTGAEASLIGRT
jgi:hypothetical protein